MLTLLLLLPLAVDHKHLHYQSTVIQSSHSVSKVQMRMVACHLDDQPRHKAVWQTQHLQSLLNATFRQREGTRIQLVALRIR